MLPNSILIYQHSRDLLLDSALTPEQIQHVLAPIGFTDGLAAYRSIQRIAADVRVRPAFAASLPHLLITLAGAATPDRTLASFERFSQSVPDAHEFFHLLAADPRLVEILVTVFAGSQFLTDILLRHPAYFAGLADRKRLAKLKSVAQFTAQAQAASGAPAGRSGGVPFADDTVGFAASNALRRFQHWELLRIGACDLLGLFDLPTVTLQLSHLADSVVQICLNQAAAELQVDPAGFAVMGMGKLGGGELNYSSDIDLLFLVDPGGAPYDPAAYERLAQCIIEALTWVTAEGFLYRVDMRLRPWGRDGPLVSTVDGYIAYLQKHARLWEKQALLKARTIAGDERVGSELLRRADPIIFNTTPAAVRADIRTMKQRIETQLRRQGRAWGEVKLGEGSIRDVEFITQFLQLIHGGRYPEVRNHNTLNALGRLVAAGFLPPDEYRILVDGYTFQRTVEHHLQMLDYLQTHSLPRDPEKLTDLARRLGFQDNPAPRGTLVPQGNSPIGDHVSPPAFGAPQLSAREKFLARYQQHASAIRSVYRRHLEDGTLLENGNRLEVDLMEGTENSPVASATTDTNPAGDDRHLARMAPSYATTFTEAEIKHHAALAERLDDENLVEIDAVSLPDGHWRVTIIAYDFLGELSLICGLLFVYGFNIHEGQIFTYEPLPKSAGARRISSPAGRRGGLRTSRTGHTDTRRKIVDVFTVLPVHQRVQPQIWTDYADDLGRLLRGLRDGDQQEVQGELARRAAAAAAASPFAYGSTPPGAGSPPRLPGATAATLYPIEIEIDNAASDIYTVLRIDAPDTTGFLYEFTNALALNNIYIGRVTVSSVFGGLERGNRVHDTLYVTDAHGKKITAPEKQRELRSATVLVKHFTHLLPLAPNPESALLHFRQFIGQLFARPNWPDEIAAVDRPEVLETLARLLGLSEFLWEDFLRMQYDNLFPVVRDVAALSTPKSQEQLRREFEAICPGFHLLAPWQATTSPLVMPETTASNPSDLAGKSDYDTYRDALNAFKDREMFRVDMRHILGYITEFGQFSGELSDVAEVAVDAAFRLCYAALSTQYGIPHLEDGSHPEDGSLCPIVVCGLGKFGGRGLGFASDIELIFIYAGSGMTRPAPGHPEQTAISTVEFYNKLVFEVVQTIRAHRDGIFEIDLRLRPYGKAGNVAVSLDSFRKYYAPRGPAWPYERQALTRLRPVAGDTFLGAQVVALAHAFIYTGGDPFDVAAMRAMRQMQVRQLVTAGTINAKFSPGGLVDIEYLVQALQIMHGKDHPEIRLQNTREAMAALAAAGFLAPEDFRDLHAAHMFVRRLINALRMVRGDARDLTVPAPDSQEFAFLARRLGYGHDLPRLQADLVRHTTAVQQISNRLLG
ncbi:MAG: glutamine synthetase adenylyltransferase [Chloroflexi bacterium]|nr:glutamine synthetase adenylyltransferase [Chloroflexota bacterium]